MSFGDRLRELRKAEKKTLRTVASDLKIAPITLSNYERGERKPKMKTMEKLSSYYGVSLDYLIKGKEAAEEKSDYDWREELRRTIEKRMLQNAVNFTPHEEIEKFIIEADEIRPEIGNSSILIMALINDFKQLKKIMIQHIGKENTDQIFKEFNRDKKSIPGVKEMET